MMIPKTADIITIFLLGKKIIPEEDTAVYRYGFELIISTIINIVLAFILGCFAGGILKAFLFYFIIASVRVHSGGYHASSYFKCNLTYILVYLLTIFFHNMLVSRFMDDMFIILGDLFVMFFMYAYAPVENVRRLLNKNEKIRAKKNAVLSAAVWSVAGIAFWAAGKKETSYFILIVLLVISCLMIVGIKEMSVQERRISLNFE